MLVIPTQAAENSYVPPQWVVSYSIFGLFILEDWQVDLCPKTPSSLHWLVTFCGQSCHSWLLGTSIAFPIRTPTPRRRWATRRVSRKSWSSLSSMSQTTSTSTLGMGTSSIRSMIACITISLFPFGGFFFQAPHSLFNVVCCGGGLNCFHHSSGASWPPGLSSLFHNSICNSSVTILHSTCSCLYLHHSLSPINWACQAESNIPCISQEEPLFEWSLSKE